MEEVDNNNINNNFTQDDSEIIADKSSIVEEHNFEDMIEDNIQANQGISFVQEDYFYKDTVYIEIESDKLGDIYYTIDGSNPDKSKKLYQGKIELVSETQTKVYTIKAKGYSEDGTETDTIVHTYFVGRDVLNRFNTLIFSVTSDPYNLYDYEYGILIEGKLRDEFVKINPYKKLDPPDPANYNIRGRESERDIYLEIFEPNGTIVVGQKAGIRVFGGWSRANLQKSLKIFARKEYDEVNNKIRYEFFPDKSAAIGDGTIVSAFKRLVLRNTGNDNGFGFIRDELFQTLAGQAGYMDYQAVRPAALFINGEYRGHLWLHEVYCDEYFEQNYGEYTGSFEILEGGETYKKADEDEANSYAIDDYEEAYSYSYKDLTDDDVYKQLGEVIDVENYIAYYALQIYIGNEDWPHNNYKVYRYYGAEGEEYKEAPFDGKWRYLLHDLDFSFGIYGSAPWTDNLKRYVSTSDNINRDSPLFSQLLKRDDCKEIFIRKTLDLVNGAFAPDNLNKVVDKMHISRMKEQLNMYDKNLITDWVRPEQLPGRMEDIKKFGSDRVIYTMGKFRELFKLGNVYKLSAKPAVKAGLRINNVETYSKFEGSYYPDYDTIISAIVPAGEEFGHWLVNGDTVYDTELIVRPSMIIDGKVEVNCVFKEEAENPKIIIREICSDGDRDYIMLYNPYKEDISLLGYSITDDIDEPGKLILPARPLRGGQSLKVIGESNQEDSTTGMIRAGFNLRDGETVTLFMKGEKVDQVTIPDLKNGSIYIRDMITMRFYEERN
jgi:hypothetical protein